MAHGSHHQQRRAGRVHHLFHHRATWDICCCAVHLALLPSPTNHARLLPRPHILRLVATIYSCASRAYRLGI